MLKIIYKNAYRLCLISTFIICIIVALYCVLNGQYMALTHTEPQGAIAGMQILFAFILTILFAINKNTRKREWFLIPIILVVFAVIYIFIVSLYPCCVGG